MNKIKFTVEDIINTLEEKIVLEQKERDAELSFLNHELIGSYNGVIGYANLIVNNSDTSELNIYQKAYLDNIQNLGKVALQNTNKVISNYRNKTEAEILKNDKNETYSDSQELMENIQSIITYTPITDKINALKELSEKNTKYTTTLDLSIDRMIDIYNEHFSKDSSKHDLNKEIKEYIQKGTNLIKIEKIDDITHIGPENYFRAAMLVFEKNIIDHATNPENDIAKRLTPEFQTEMKIWMEPNHKDKLLTVYVQDNGFGINPSIQHKLFEKGASSKTDKSTEHGIGLWYVKNFVEKYGGTIGFKSELGYGTTFNFTIPYDRISESGEYIKDKSE